MSRYAPFEGPGRFLKGNLHSHTTRSDGPLSLEQTVSRYRELGYDFLCVSDHNRYYRGGDMQGMTLLPGMESDAVIRGIGGADEAVHHFVAIGAREDGYAHDDQVAFTKTDTPEKSQKMVDELRAYGNLVLLAHPYWSHADYADYGHLRGLWGMEVYNHGCHIENDTGYAGNAWHQMLSKGLDGPPRARPLFAAATDDTHISWQYGGGWIMAYAETQSAASIISALEQGRFYASTGPEITALIRDGRTVEVSCSPCLRVMFITEYINLGHKSVCEHDNAGPVTHARHTLPDGIRMVRVQCVDHHGRIAFSQPIML